MPIINPLHIEAAKPFYASNGGDVISDIDNNFSALNNSISARLITVGTSSAYDYVCDGVADDVEIQSALDSVHAAGGGEVRIAAGTYYLANRLTIYSRTRLVGASKYATTIQSTNSGAGQTITGGGLLYGVDLNNVTVDGIYFQGVGKTGTNCFGIKFDLVSAGNIQHINLRNIRVNDCAGHGIELNDPIMSTLDNVRVVNTTGDGIYMYNGTSTNLFACYVGASNQAGYNLFTMTYCNLVGCASESNGYSYLLDSSGNCNLFACGAEVSHDVSSSYPGTHYKIKGGTCNSLISCYAREFDTGANSGNKNYLDVSNSATNIYVQGLRGSATVAPTNTYKIATGCTVRLQDYTFSGSLGGGASGTPSVDSTPSQHVVTSASTGTFAVSRASTVNFANYSLRTAGVDQWTYGMRNDSTNDFHMRDNINGRTPLKINQSDGVVTFSANHINIAGTKTPASGTDTGNPGDICWDASYLYVCIGTNQWRQIGLNNIV